MRKIKSKRLAEIYLEKINFDDGEEVHYVSFKYPESVAILPIINEKEIILVNQFRYSINEYSWEIPAGGINEKENNIDAAKRELREETGYYSENFEYLYSVYPSNAMSNEKIHLFKAFSLVEQEIRQNNELLERDIEVKIFPLSDILRMIKNGIITDAVTIIALQFLFINNDF